MKVLWKFESRVKLDPFITILERHNITYEISSTNQTSNSSGALILSVDENDYEKAKKLLMKHRKRRTSGDLS